MENVTVELGTLDADDVELLRTAMFMLGCNPTMTPGSQKDRIDQLQTWLTVRLGIARREETAA